jgi:hypothetical protein
MPDSRSNFLVKSQGPWLLESWLLREGGAAVLTRQVGGGVTHWQSQLLLPFLLSFHLLFPILGCAPDLWLSSEADGSPPPLAWL